MKSISLIVLNVFIFILSKNVNAQQWDWAVGFGGKGLERIWDVKVGKAGNIYIAGQFTDTLTINQHQYISSGLSDIFLAKFNRNGQFIWLNTFGSKNEDVAIAIGIDANENSYITGYFTDTLQIADTSMIAKGGWDLFLIKNNADGNFQWARQIKGTAGEVGYGIAVSDEGNSYITGWYQDSIEFHNGSVLYNYGSSDILIAKYDTYGNLAWAKHAGTAGIEYGYKVSCDDFGNCFVTGVVGEPNCNFDGLILDKTGMFVAKYNSNGTIQWAIAGESTSVNDISVEKNGNGFVSGRFNKNAFFGNDSIISFNNTDDAYIARYDKDGNWIWAIAIGNNGADKGRCIENDFNSNAYIGLTFDSTLIINNLIYYTKGVSDIIVQMVDSFSIPKWGISAGGNYDDVISDIALDSMGNIVIVGWYSDTCYFGNKTIYSSGQSDVNCFVAQISPPVSGISSDRENSNWMVFPNPAKNILNVEFKNLNSSNILFRLYNIFGVEVICIPIKKTQTTIDVSKMKAGVYFYQIIQKQKCYKGKVIIL